MNGDSILIVDDEPLVRDLLVTLSQDAGFDPQAVPNAREALEIFSSRSDIAIVVTDVRMPGKMNGIDLVVELARRANHLKFILTSGYGVPSDVRLPPDVIFVAKPYTETQVLEALRAALPAQ